MASNDIHTSLSDFHVSLYIFIEGFLEAVIKKQKSFSKPTYYLSLPNIDHYRISYLVNFAHPSGGPLFHPSTSQSITSECTQCRGPAIEMSKPLPLSVSSRAWGAALISIYPSIFLHQSFGKWKRMSNLPPAMFIGPLNTEK